MKEQGLSKNEAIWLYFIIIAFYSRLACIVSVRFQPYIVVVIGFSRIKLYSIVLACIFLHSKVAYC